MRGADEQPGSMFSYVSLEARVPADHPLRAIRWITDRALERLSPRFGTLYVNFGRRWTQGFAVTISRRMMTGFEAAGLTPKTLENRIVRVRGWVEQRGGPRIEALWPAQIELVGNR